MWKELLAFWLGCCGIQREGGDPMEKTPLYTKKELKFTWKTARLNPAHFKFEQKTGDSPFPDVRKHYYRHVHHHHRRT